MVGDTLVEGDTSGPAGIVCCGASEAAPGSKGRLVMNIARKVASAAATMMLIAIQGSLPGGLACGRLLDADWCRRDASTTIRLFGGRVSGTWSFRPPRL